MQRTLGYLMQQLRVKSLVKYEVENDGDNEK